MKKFSFICNNKEEAINIQKILLKDGYTWGNESSYIINFEKLKIFGGYPILIICNTFKDHQMLHDTRYYQENINHFKNNNIDLGEEIYASVYLRKLKLKKLNESR